MEQKDLTQKKETEAKPSAKAETKTAPKQMTDNQLQRRKKMVHYPLN